MLASLFWSASNSTNKVGKTRDVPCPATRTVNQSTPQNARQQKHQALNESHAVNPIASRVSSGANYVPRGLTNRAHMTVTSRDVFIFSHRRPQSSLPSHWANPSQANCLAKTGSARNRCNLLHYSFVHSSPGLRTASRNDTLQDSARTTVHASHNTTLSALSTSASTSVSSYTQ